ADGQGGSGRSRGARHGANRPRPYHPGVLGFLGQLTPRQRQDLAALTSCLVLLGLALGVVALGDPGDGSEEAVQTEAGASTSTTADDPVASVPVDGTSTSDPGADDEDAG